MFLVLKHFYGGKEYIKLDMPKHGILVNRKIISSDWLLSTQFASKLNLLVLGQLQIACIIMIWNKQISCYGGVSLYESPMVSVPWDLQRSQGVDWTADTLWAHVDTIIQCFKARGLPPPIVYIHNHAPWPMVNRCPESVGCCGCSEISTVLIKDVCYFLYS